MNIIHLLYLHVYFIKNLHVVMFHTSRICLPSITKYAVKTSPNANLFLPFSSFAQNRVFWENIHLYIFSSKINLCKTFCFTEYWHTRSTTLRYIVFLKKVWKISTYLSHIDFIYIYSYKFWRKWCHRYRCQFLQHRTHFHFCQMWLILTLSLLVLLYVIQQ